MPNVGNLPNLTAAGDNYLESYIKIGTYKSLKDIAKNWSLERKFIPKIKNYKRKILIMECSMMLN